MEIKKLDFCVLDNPLNVNKGVLIFVTRKGEKHLDTTIIQEDEYEKAISVMQNLGYVESDILTFEFSQDPDFQNITKDELVDVLKGNGMSYSKEFEDNLIREFEFVKQSETNNVLQSLYDNVESNLQISKRGKIKIPDIGEKVSLYFYLFLECKFKGDSCLLNFNGDFYSYEENDTRNFIKIMKCDFIRINNPYNPNKIILKSILNNSEIIKKVQIIKSGSFTKRDKSGNGKIFVYHIMEVKNNIPNKNRITVEVESLGSFYEMMYKSDQIKKQKRKMLNMPFIKEEEEKALEECAETLKNKMILHARSDEFEKASIIKKDTQKVERCLKRLRQYEGELNFRVVEKKFNIG